MTVTRNAYRVVNVGTIVLAVAIAILLAVLKDQDANDAAADLLVALATLDVLAVAYITRTAWTSRRSKKPGGRLLDFLLSDNAITTIGICGIAFVIVRAFLGYPPLDAQAGRLIIGMSLVLLAVVPIRNAALFFLVSRDTGPAQRRRFDDVPGRAGGAMTDLQLAIRDIEEARERHLEWIQTPPTPEESRIAGDVDSHRDWVRRYEHVLAVLRGRA